MYSFRCRFRAPQTQTWFVSVTKAAHLTLAVQACFADLFGWLKADGSHEPPYAYWYLVDVVVLEQPSWSIGRLAYSAEKGVR